MAAHDQVERAFTLTDAALADNQHAEAEDVDEDAVNDLAMREPILEHGGQLPDCRRRRHRRAQDWHIGALALRNDLGRNVGAARDEQAWQVGVEALGQRFAARARIEALEETHLALAEQQDAPGLEVLVKSSERQAGLL